MHSKKEKWAFFRVHAKGCFKKRAPVETTDLGIPLRADKRVFYQQRSIY
jgi:hypothetical protein